MDKLRTGENTKTLLFLAYLTAAILAGMAKIQEGGLYWFLAFSFISSIILIAFYSSLPHLQTPIVLGVLGIGFNELVTLANGGMPAFEPLPEGIWIPLTDNTRLVFLADILPWGSSYGDWVMGLALIWAIIATIKSMVRKHERAI